MIIKGETDLSPQDLLISLKNIEFEMGRPKIYERWSPRIIDLDILLWDQQEINTPSLTIPHPELGNRPFLTHLLALMGLSAWTETFMDNPFTNSFVLNPAFVGIVNITNDSFSDGGQFNKLDKAIDHIHKLINDGASIIEIGAQSTRPGAFIGTPEEEYNTLKLVLDEVPSFTLSIDTFWPYVVKKILEKYQISWINDVKGKFDDETLKMIAQSGCKFCCMHSLSIPPSPEKILPLDQNPMNLLKEWGIKLIDRLLGLGFSQENIILDPGIGFGKSAYQNIEILRNVGELKDLGTKVMVGHSRKSYIGSFSSAHAKDRDIETIATSLALKNKVDFLRVHNVKDHMRFFVSYENSSQGDLI
jgi:2-amino-4-hydroxy-6-hydroxymethyldihydropteridine diphosphokinase/dihydropteroate synthase